MAVTHWVYANAMLAMACRTGALDWDTNTQKMSLHTSTYTPNQDTHDFFNDAANEITGTGYTALGATLASKTNALTNNVLALDCADVTWASSTLTARRAVVADQSGGSAATNALWSWIDFGQDESSNNGNFTVQVNASGLITLTAADATGFP